MHVLMTGVGSAGDVHPLLAVGRELVTRGHRVTLLTNPVFAPLAERCGLRFLPLGTAESYQQSLRRADLWAPSTSFSVLWEIVADTMQPQFDQLLGAVDDDTVLVGSLWAIGARLIHEKFGVPLVTAQVSASTFLSASVPPVHQRFSLPAGLPRPARAALLWLIERGVLDRTCAPALNALRAQLGLRPVSRILSRWLNSPQRVLGLFPAWFAPPQTDWPSRVALTGFPRFETSDENTPDGELDAFVRKGAPPVVFCLGSTPLDGNAFWEAAAGALKQLGRRGIFVAPGDDGHLASSSILRRPYLPLARVLPHAGAIVHHGGVGTMAFSFAAGIPQVVTPFAHDQFDNAARMTRLGCGVRIEGPPDAAALANALRQTLGSADIAERCRFYQRRLHKENACQRAAMAVEELAPPCRNASRNNPLPI